MEIPKAINAKNPTEKFLWTEKLCHFYSKSPILANFWPFLTQKSALWPKIKRFDPNFLHSPLQYHETWKVNENKNKVIVKNFSGWHFLKLAGHYGPPLSFIGLIKNTQIRTVYMTTQNRENSWYLPQGWMYVCMVYGGREEYIRKSFLFK